MKRIKQAVTSLIVAMVMVTGLTVALSPFAHADIDPSGSINSGVKDAGGGTTNSNLGVNIKSIVNVLLYVLGAIAVIMIVIGGIRYALSGGDSNSVTGAKNTILYAVVGLVVAMLAYAIVNWVIGAFKPADPQPTGSVPAVIAQR